jgi:outer membrane immunogenic protein
MKTKLALAAAAVVLSVAQVSAADMRRPVYKATAPAATVYNWSGFYVGGHVGYGWADNTWNDPTVFFGNPALSDKPDGFLGGGQVGWNWQAAGSPWVFGVEADWSWTNADDSFNFVGFGIPQTNSSDVDWYATLTGRIGYAWGASLLYVKGGGAWMKAEYTNRDAVLPTFMTGSDTRSGWTVGVGFEQAIANTSWTWKVEYNYLDFGRDTINLVGPSAGVIVTAPVTVDTEAHLFKAGLNYRFDWGKGPVVAKY